MVSCWSLFYYFMCLGVSTVYNHQFYQVLPQNNPFQLTVDSLIEPCSLQASECLHQLCQGCQWRPAEAVRLPGTGGTDGCKLPCGC